MFNYIRSPSNSSKYKRTIDLTVHWSLSSEEPCQPTVFYKPIPEQRLQNKKPPAFSISDRFILFHVANSLL
jgi:hypothetical protein